MQYFNLGKTSLKVSQLCFGALTIGPLQRHLSIEEGSKLIRQALELGINFIDTAELYNTYPYIKKALVGWQKDVIIATKSYDYTREGMKKSLENARKSLNLDVIPIFLLHEQESEHTLRGHWPAFEELLDAKRKDMVKAVGISTHHVEAVWAASDISDIDIISPLINVSGIGIQGGNCQDMLTAIKYANSLNKGIYAMKPLGGGHLINRWKEALNFLVSNKDITSVAMGMKSERELKSNIDFFNGKEVSIPSLTHRKLHIDDWCTNCCNCIKVCGQNALYSNGKHVVNQPHKCVFCGYCGAVCPEFAIKVI